LSFAVNSGILSRGTREWQVSGDESELHFGSSRPSAVLRDALENSASAYRRRSAFRLRTWGPLRRDPAM